MIHSVHQGGLRPPAATQPPPSPSGANASAGACRGPLPPCLSASGPAPATHIAAYQQNNNIKTHLAERSAMGPAGGRTAVRSLRSPSRLFFAGGPPLPVTCELCSHTKGSGRLRRRRRGCLPRLRLAPGVAFCALRVRLSPASLR